MLKIALCCSRFSIILVLMFSAEVKNGVSESSSMNGFQNSSSSDGNAPEHVNGFINDVEIG